MIAILQAITKMMPKFSFGCTDLGITAVSPDEDAQLSEGSAWLTRERLKSELHLVISR